MLYGLFIYLFFKLSVFVYVLRWIQFIYWGHTCVYILYACTDAVLYIESLETHWLVKIQICLDYFQNMFSCLPGHGCL